MSTEISSVTPAPTRSDARTGRVDFLDGIRALAAVYVVAHHIWLTTYPQYPRNSGPTAVGWLLYGHLAVSVFIVISGFSLAIAPARHDWRLRGGVRTFLARRAWRILPTYWAALALSAIVFGAVTPSLTGDAVTVKGLLVHAVLLQDVINTPKPNGAFWSIAIEFQIYLILPLLLWVFRRRGPVVMVGALLLAVVGAHLLGDVVPAARRLDALTPQFAVLFGFGVVAARVLTPGRAVSRRAGSMLIGIATAVLVAFVVATVTRGSVWIDAQYFWVDLAVGAAVACAVAALAAHRMPALAAALSSRPLRGTGRFSYSIYCVHLPILWLLWHFVITRVVTSTDARFVTLLAVGLPVVIVGSWAFSAVFEQPFLVRRSWAAWRLAVQNVVAPSRRSQAPTVSRAAG